MKATESMVAASLKEAERQINDAKFVVGCVIGDCVMYDRLRAMRDELLDMINSLTEQ